MFIFWLTLGLTAHIVIWYAAFITLWNKKLYVQSAYSG